MQAATRGPSVNSSLGQATQTTPSGKRFLNAEAQTFPNNTPPFPTPQPNWVQRASWVLRLRWKSSSFLIVSREKR